MSNNRVISDLSGTLQSSFAIGGSLAMKQGDAAGGDLGGNFPNPTVSDDSHNHTSSTLPATMPPSAHDLLSAAHGDTTAAAVVRGDLVIGSGATPKWSRYALAVPAANVLNVLAVANGETEPTWKALFDSSNPASVGTATPGTSLLAAHRDHVHSGAASITGTANQVLANGTSGAAQTGAVTLTTPQDIAITSSPQFANLKITGGGHIFPSVDSTGAIRFAQADGTDWLYIDTLNKRFGVNVVPTTAVDIAGALQATLNTNPVAYIIYNGASGPNNSSELVLDTNDGSAMAANDRLGSFGFRGNNGSGVQWGAEISAYASELWSGSQRGSRFVFKNIAAGTTTLISALTIDQLQRAIFNHTASITVRSAAINMLVQAYSTQTNNGIAGFQAIRYTDDTSGGFFMVGKSRGTTVGTHATVNVNDDLGAVEWIGDDGTNYQAAARIRAFSDATPSSTEMPGRLEFQTTPPGTTLPVVRMAIDRNGKIAFTPAIVTSGSPNQIILTAAAHTTLAIAEFNDIRFDLSRTVNFAAGGGNITTLRSVFIDAPTYTATTNTVTIADAATVAISGPPVASTNITITRAHAFWVQSGESRFSGQVIILPPSTDSNTPLNITSPDVSTPADVTIINITAGSPTGLDPATTYKGVYFGLGGDNKFKAGGGTATEAHGVLFDPPQYSALTNAVTITTAATVTISGSPTAGTNMTLSNPYALWVKAGVSRFVGGIDLSAANLSTDATTGTQFASSSTHKMSWWGASPTARGSAFTQTYSTADKTLNADGVTNPATYGAGTNGYSTAAMAQAVHAAVIALHADLLDVKQFCNAIVDQLQTYGMFA